MKEIVIPMEIDYNFKKKKKKHFIFYFLPISFSKKNEK